MQMRDFKTQLQSHEVLKSNIDRLKDNKEDLLARNESNEMIKEHLLNKVNGLETSNL
jgi:hypothetical protein